MIITTEKKNKLSVIIIVISLLAILISGSFGTLHIHEFLSILIFGKSDSYPFGNSGPVPYYYKTATLYAMVCLVWGLVFMTNGCIAVWALMKKKIKLIIITFFVAIALTIIMFIHGNIGV